MKILSRYSNWYYQEIMLVVLFLFCIVPSKYLLAQEAECAEVKIVIEQKLSFERQAFDARMVISNGLSSDILENVKIELFFMDKDNQLVSVTEDPNATEATFFYRVNSLSGISDINGNGQVAAKSNAEVHWLIIPTYGAAEFEDTLYFIGAQVSYTLNDQVTTVDVTPDYVVVKPQPMLSLDYFFPSDVYADDPFTPEVEPSIPFTLGVRVKNSGAGSSYKTTIESAQPKIVENEQNLLIDFLILGGYVGNQPAGKSLLLDFGDIEPLTSKVGRWSMITTLSGKFTEFSATFTHADTLGGAVTSLLKEVNTHTLVHDVRVDLAGRDSINDFLALDGDVLRVYESEGIDSEVNDQSASASLEAEGEDIKLVFPATQGLVYIKMADPYLGSRELVNVKRSDGKILPQENVWLSKTRNDDLSWSHSINLFDTNSTGIYNLFEKPMNQIIGTSGNDTLYGTDENDYIDGKEGNDTIYGRAGNDILIGGPGDDKLYGEAGDDRLEAGEGDDYLYGGAGDDILVAGPGSSFLQGGAGNDTYIIHRGDGLVTINDSGSSSDEDKVIFEDLASTDIGLVELIDNNTLVINFTSGDKVTFQNRTSLYNQIASYQFADGVVFTTADILTNNPIILPQAGTYTFSEKADHVIGSEGNDTIRVYGGDDYVEARSGNNTIYGGDGNDILIGGTGNDTLHGENGNDRLEAGEGDDYLYGGAGDDILVAGPGSSFLQGGNGNDTYIIHRGDGLVTINDSGSSSDEDKVIFEDLASTDIALVELIDNDTLVINFTSGDKVIFQRRTLSTNQIASYQFADGVVFTTEDILTYKPITLTQAGSYTFTSKDDHVIGSSGNDILYGRDGNDILIGGSGDDRLYGENGDDRLEAGEGDDYLYGGAGDDILVAGPGSSFLQGGAGNDTYIIHRGDGLVTIYDSGSTSDEDKVIFEDLASTDIALVELIDNNTLVINFSSGDKVIFQRRTLSTNQIASYQFADGVVLTTADLLNKIE
ncbi:calcium-binding protein [Entomomonas asaccharolytica]|uniref:calcium-binding protein n=1 Tax=Entomomonas asaccharolytica TaxID=2785331 RepID=UPI00362E128B